MIYRVIIKVSYHEAYFDFDSSEEAMIFAEQALNHNTDSEDSKKARFVKIELINQEVKEDEDE